MGIPELDFNFHILDLPCSTLLHCAVHLNDPSLVACLLAGAADSNLQNGCGVSSKQLAMEMTSEVPISKNVKDEDMEASKEIMHLLNNSYDQCVVLSCSKPTVQVTKGNMDSATPADNPTNNADSYLCNAIPSNGRDTQHAVFNSSVGVVASNTVGSQRVNGCAVVLDEGSCGIL